MNTKNSLISAQNISVVKNQKAILKNIDIEINKNDFLTIIGPNGAGKTSTFNLIMGLIKPNKGNIFLSSKIF
jgi:lipopolysaccharide export system ATP-binding protein